VIYVNIRSGDIAWNHQHAYLPLPRTTPLWAVKPVGLA
jgi:hypothetical protein